ncbi:MAG: hypothetical protein AAFX87_16230 [Bacteroidota bacterium]
MSLENLKTKIEGVVEDLATLEVASFSGKDIDVSAATDGDGNLSSSQVFGKIRTAMLTAELVGYSRFELEGDTINYINSDLGEDKTYLVEGHNALVEGAQTSRKDFFDFVRKVLRS